MHDFYSFIRSQGIIPPADLIPGKWIRCGTVDHPKKKNGSIKLALDGQIGWIQNHAIQSEPIIWRPNCDNAVLVTIDQAAIAKINAERRRALVEATIAARAYYAACKPLRNLHAYLSNKGLGMQGCEQLRIDDKGWLIIPMLYNGKILSLQRISETGEKKFHYGASTKGSYFVIERQGATLTALAEGFATGMTIFNAIPSSRVIVCFNAGNMPIIAQSIALSNMRSGMAVICGDNDHATLAKIGKNPGRDAGDKAAEILGVGAAYPECSGSDWNDYALEEIERLFGGQQQSYTPKKSILQIEMAVHAKIKLQVMRAARLLRKK